MIFTTALADTDAATIETALEGLTGEAAGDVVYALAGDGDDAALVRADVTAETISRPNGWRISGDRRSRTRSAPTMSSCPIRPRPPVIDRLARHARRAAGVLTHRPALAV